LSDDTLFGRGSKHEPVLNKPTPSAKKRNVEASGHRDLAVGATMTQTRARDTEDPNSGPHHHPSSGLR
jgi:hypothetical protein